MRFCDRDDSCRKILRMFNSQVAGLWPFCLTFVPVAARTVCEVVVSVDFALRRISVMSNCSKDMISTRGDFQEMLSPTGDFDPYPTLEFLPLHCCCSCFNIFRLFPECVFELKGETTMTRTKGHGQKVRV